jgi:predicted RNA-binding protein Jag
MRTVMKKVKNLLAAMLFIATFPGCIEISTLISIQTDGSGTVEETVLLSREIIEMITELEKAFATDTTEYKPFDFYDENELKVQASQFGEEVRYISSKKISRENKEGYLVMYEFRDLNKVRINQNPNSRVRLESFDDETEVQEEFITFSYISGQPSEIRIQMPAEDMIGDSNDNDIEDSFRQDIEQDTAQINEQLSRIFQDLKIAMEVEVEGNISRTNADYIEGSRITLLDIDFGKLVDNPDKLKEFREADPQNFEQVKTIIKSIPGIKVDLNKLIIVQVE